jgi:hypothetical protein
VSRGDRNRNARLERLRSLVPVENAIVGIDLADAKQMVVVTDHDSKVLARKTFRCRAWQLGAALDWAAQRAAARGFAGVTVSCEPTGHRWRVLAQLAADRSMPFVCVQSAVSSWSRRVEDLTEDKTDEKDAVLIARLTAQLRCYQPESVDEVWARLRHLGIRREQLIAETSGQVQQIRDLLECVWPAALDTARQPFRSRTWIAALSVIVARDGGVLARTRARGPARFEQAVRREISRRGGQKPRLRIVRGMFNALADPAGVIGHRAGALERVGWLLEDWTHAHHRLVETRNPDDRGARRTRTHRPGHLDHRHLRSRGGRDPRAKRRPETVRHRPRAGQTRRAGTTAEAVRHVHRPHQTHRARPARVAAGGLARGLGRPASQPGLPRPLPAPDHPREQQVQTDPGASRHRRRDPAPPTRGHHHRPRLGRRDRHTRHETTTSDTSRGLINSAVGSPQADGRGEPDAALRHTLISTVIMGSLSALR